MSPAPPHPALLDELLLPLHVHFQSARTAYRAYLDNGRTFDRARALRRINVAARALLVDRGGMLPDALRPAAAALVDHYDIWLRLWDAHAERARPAPDDLFAFANAATYPREAERKLEQLYETLRGGG